MQQPDKMAWQDANGKRWSTAIKFQDAVRLRESAGIDLLLPATMEQLFGPNPLERIETIAELARPQWQEANLSYTEFADLIVGGPTTLIAATAALRSAITDFFRRLDRNDLAIVVDRAWDAMVKGLQVSIEKASGPKIGQVLQAAIDKMDREIDDGLDKALQSMLGSIQTSIPGRASGD